MSDDSILKKVIKGLGQIGTETVEKSVENAGKIASTIITGKQLVGDIKPLSEGEMAKAKAEDEVKRQEGIEKELKNIPGRDVTGEMKEVAQEEKNEEDQKQKEFLEKIKQQREEEERERQEMVEVPGNAKREAAKTQFAPGKRKKQQPDAAAMSQTSEFKGGKID